MKFLIFGTALVGSLLLGFLPGGVAAPKPAWWRWLTSIACLVLICFALGLPTAGTFGGAAMVSVARGTIAVVPIRGTVTEVAPQQQSISLEDANDRVEAVDLSALSQDDRASLSEGKDVILAMKKEGEGYKAEYIVSRSPWLALPLIPALEERARNIYFHVPSAWLAELAWGIAMVFGILYLRKRRIEDDVKASSAAAVGAVFCLLATATGSVWAKFNWGSFWNWDPRQTSIFIVLIIYGAYFALRSAIDNTELRARISSLYLMLLIAPVTFFIFIYPRINPGLHPGAEGSGTIGPVIDPEAIWLNTIKQNIFALGFFSFTLLYFWIVNLSVRSRLLEIRGAQGAVGAGVTDTPRYTISAIDS